MPQLQDTKPSLKQTIDAALNIQERIKQEAAKIAGQKSASEKGATAPSVPTKPLP